MLQDSAQIEAALAPLVGLPLWRSHRVAEIQVFQFGEKRTVTSNLGPRKGQELEVGEYALHVSCAWRVRGAQGIVVGSGDRTLRAGNDPLDGPDDWDWEKPGATRCDERVREWLDGRSYNVDRVGADATGGLMLALAAGFVLEVFPDDSLDGEYSEHWRLLRPAEQTSHFVVSGSGIDPGDG